MSYRDQVSEEVKAAAENSNGGGNGGDQEELNQIEVDFSETPFVKFAPTTMPTFTFPEEDEGNPIILFKNNQRLTELGDEALNDDGRDLRLLSTRYLGLVVDDIGTVDDDEFEDNVIIETLDESTDYRVFDRNDAETTIEPRYTKGDDGEPVEDGVEVEHGGRTYKGHEVDEIEGRSILVVDRTASTSVARTLDVRGGPLAGMDESTGDVNGGLVEYFPDDADYPDNGRYARPFVELRPDLQGEDIGIMVTRRSEVDEDFAEEIAGNDNRNDMLWYSVFDMETDEVLERGDYGEPVAYSYLQEGFDPEAGHLPDDQWNFVQEYISNELPKDEDTILENVEENFDDANEERITRLIQDEVTAE